MSLTRQHSFWGSLSPFGGLTGAGLLIMGSARLSWAITIAGSLFWVYGLSTFTYLFLVLSAKKIFPVEGRKTLYVCLSSFWGSVYLLMFWLLCPLAALETFFLLLFVPLFCAYSGIVEHINTSIKTSHSDIFEFVPEAVSQAAVLSALLIVFSIVREPLAYCTLSFPGTFQGMFIIFQFNANSFFPIEIFSSAAGAFLLLGYSICLYQYSKSTVFPGEKS
jgi:hypothetical protein